MHLSQIKSLPRTLSEDYISNTKKSIQSNISTPHDFNYKDSLKTDFNKT